MFFLDWNSFDTVEKSGGHKNVMHLDSLPTLGGGLPKLASLLSLKSWKTNDETKAKERSENEGKSVDHKGGSDELAIPTVHQGRGSDETITSKFEPSHRRCSQKSSRSGSSWSLHEIPSNLEEEESRTGDKSRSTGPPKDHKGSEGPPSQSHATPVTGPSQSTSSSKDQPSEGGTSHHPLMSFLQHLRPHSGHDQHRIPKKLNKIYGRSQVISKSTSSHPPPPRTSFFESFPSLINPPLPDEKFITQPSARAKTIFHDRVYAPEDIPPVSASQEGTTSQEGKKERLRVEEKIARDWHCDMSWRKVLVKLEPDAHNNIVVRRMFAKMLMDGQLSDILLESILRGTRMSPKEMIMEERSRCRGRGMKL
jgi:hypothetical protein